MELFLYLGCKDFYMQTEINKVELRNLRIEDYKELRLSMQHAYKPADMEMDEPYW